MAGRECYHCKQWIEDGEEHNCWTTTEAALTKMPSASAETVAPAVLTGSAALPPMYGPKVSWAQAHHKGIVARFTGIHFSPAAYPLRGPHGDAKSTY
jgi:hypothetical protein